MSLNEVKLSQAWPMIRMLTVSYCFCVGQEKPTFDNRCKVFELDPCDGYGRVCLVYKESRTGNSSLPIIMWDCLIYLPFHTGLRWNCKCTVYSY